MHTLLLVVVTSGLLLLLTTQGLTANLELDADFLEEATDDGFIVSTTKGPTKTEKPQDNVNAIVTHDSLNPEANLSLLQRDSLPTVTIAKSPEVSTEFNTENTQKFPKNKPAAVLNTVASSQTTTLSPEENAEGSGIFPEWVLKTHTLMTHTTIETVAEVDINSEGSGMFSVTVNEKQDENLPFTTTVRNSEGLDTSTHVYHLSDKNGDSGIRSEAPTSDLLTTMPNYIVEENVNAVQGSNKAKEEKPMDDSNPDLTEKAANNPKIRLINVSEYEPEPTKSALTKEGTPGWLLILALCLILGAVICVFIGIGTKDKWYGPSRQCLSSNSTESKNHDVYNNASTLPLSEKEEEALMSSQKTARKETDCTISIEEEVPEKEYLM